MSYIFIAYFLAAQKCVMHEALATEQQTKSSSQSLTQLGIKLWQISPLHSFSSSHFPLTLSATVPYRCHWLYLMTFAYFSFSLLLSPLFLSLSHSLCLFRSLMCAHSHQSDVEIYAINVPHCISHALWHSHFHFYVFAFHSSLVFFVFFIPYFSTAAK